MTNAHRSTGEHDGEPRRRSRWRSRGWAVVACGAAAVALSGSVHASAPAQGSPGARSSPAPAVQLTLGAPLAFTLCEPSSFDRLGEMPMAFSGTVTAVQDGTARMEVDRWYRGGRSAQVLLLEAPGYEDGWGQWLRPGGRYLVTAGQDVVNTCGTGPWNPNLEAAFQEAFER